MSNEQNLIGHNSDREKFENQTFLNCLAQITAADSEIASLTGDRKDVYDRLKRAGGWTKDDIKWAKQLKAKNASEVLATMQRRIRIAKLLGHDVGRQIEMSEIDRTPIEDRAYQEGFAVGAQRGEMSENNFGQETAAGQKWIEGFHEGTAFINLELSKEFESELGAEDTEVIPGSTDDDGVPFSDGSDMSEEEQAAEAALEAS